MNSRCEISRAPLEALNQTLDFYYHPDFVTAEATWNKMELAVIQVVTERAKTSFALLIESFDDHARAVSPYGYGGPDASFFEPNVLSHFGNFAAAQGWSSVFLRCHPFFGRAATGTEVDGGWSVADNGRLIIVDRPSEDLSASYSKGLRRDLARAHREPLSVEVAALHADAEPFGELYRKAMVRLEAKPSLHYSDVYLQAVGAGLRENAQVFSAISGGARVATACFIFGGTYGHYYLSAADYESELAGYGMKLVVDAGLRWCMAQGAVAVNMGGGVGGAEDGLFAFKRRFGDREVSFQSLRLISDTDSFRRLYDTDPACALQANHFPPRS